MGTATTRSSRSSQKAGWVYVLTNPAHRDDLVKIGLTTRTPQARAAELSADTGVPAPFEVAHAVYVTNCRAVEREVHGQLQRSRLPGREFFAVSLKTAIAAVERAARAYRPRRRPGRGRGARWLVGASAALMVVAAMVMAVVWWMGWWPL